MIKLKKFAVFIFLLSSFTYIEINNSSDKIRDAIYAEKTFHEIYHPLRCIRTEKFKYILNFLRLNQEYQIPKENCKKIIIEIWKNPCGILDGKNVLEKFDNC